MELISKTISTPILVETQGYEGVRRIADTLAGDFEMVTGLRPACISQKELTGAENGQVILCATVDKSPLLDEMERSGKISLQEIRGKREVFQIRLVDNPFEKTGKALVICGSDKRGTIYGMFTLSEYIGVSPLVYWGDVSPAHRESIVVDSSIEQVSKEPSVKYRGFFINDEWPCFGSWVNEHFGGFNASAYKEVFEFLLRMKGNYLWPAMWTASFSLDGPGSANEELADIYGVVMGYSHHEPCLRASEEWDKVRGEDSEYGNEWNFYTNEQGLLKYWEDALKRSGGYENIITIGMRGERDTSMLGEQATVEENVSLLKDIIKKQRQLIARNVNEKVSEVPQLLALYKEVEQYFYGEDKEGRKITGLKDYEELDGVTCMLCEDNFGHMRTLPTEDIRNRRGGFGMYYHLDYHGAPISHEWVDSTPLSKIWEQMCMAYEYGIRDVWIVNVGDVKFHEVPLTYFLALAYDYDKWGYGNAQSYREYTAEWVDKCFPAASQETKNTIGYVYTEYTRLNGLRRPEALHEGIYHPCHYIETDRMLEQAEKVGLLSESVLDELDEREKDAYYSMVHFPATASMNLLEMHLYAGKNAHFARQGKPVANVYKDMAAARIKEDRALAEKFAAFKNGKWNGMQLAPHIGFTKWNEDGSRYPVLCRVEPVQKPRMAVSRADDERTACKNYGKPEEIVLDDFLYEGCERTAIEIANDGIGEIHYRITPQEGRIPDWLRLSSTEGTVKTQECVILKCNRELLSENPQTVRLLVEDGETCVALVISAKKAKTDDLPPMTFLPGKDAVVIGAEHFVKNKGTGKGTYRVIEDYGKYSAGVKVFPSTAVFGETEEKPELTYRFLSETSGKYVVELLVAPTNSVVNLKPLRLMVTGGRESRIAEILPADFRAGDYNDERWNKGVLDQIRIVKTELFFDEGVQELTVGALEAGVVLERIRIYPEGSSLKDSYLGPQESFRIRS